MNKVALVALGAVAAVLAARKAKENQHDQAVWAEVTDDVERGDGSASRHAGRRAGPAGRTGGQDRRSDNRGAMAQLVAHLLCKQGVRGSSPLGSTAGQRPFPSAGRGLFRVRTPEKYCSGLHLACGVSRKMSPEQDPDVAPTQVS